jgi:hypothetical protein
VVNSREIANLVDTLKSVKDRANVGDILAFIEDKLRHR